MKAQFDAERTEQEAEDRDRDEARNQAIARIQEGEKEKIEATQKGSAARLAAIDSRLRKRIPKVSRKPAFYRSLLIQRVQTVQEMAQEEARIREEAGKEAAKHDEKMGALRIAAEHEHQLLLNSTHHMAADQLVAQEIQEANKQYAVKMEAFNRELQALGKHGKDYENKLKAIQDRETSYRSSTRTK